MSRTSEGDNRRATTRRATAQHFGRDKIVGGARARNPRVGELVEDYVGYVQARLLRKRQKTAAERLEASIERLLRLVKQKRERLARLEREDWGAAEEQRL